MKRAERRHLKDNELAMLAANVKETYEERQREIQLGIIGVVVLAVVLGGWFAWRQHVQSRSHELLADALVVDNAPVGPPRTPDVKEVRFATEREKLQAAQAKFKLVADQYPSTDAGLLARYREGGLWLALGNTDAAAKAYQEVINRAGNDVYGQMARLGLAETQARAGQYDQAINTFKELSANKDGMLPVDGILMQLGRTYRDAGKRTEAQQTFNRVVEEFPESPFSADAKRELDDLKKT
jgi:tetratricopeptide (TPR) repeat protein